MKKFFITGGFGNNIFQKIWLKNNKNIKKISLLERKSFINNFFTKFSIHNDLINFNDDAIKPIFIDFFMLIILFFKKKISSKDYVSVSIFKYEWHFGYYQNDFIMNKSATKIYKEISNKKNFEFQSIEADYGVIHIRRGDFNKGDRVLEFEYYTKSLNYLIGINKMPNKILIIGPITDIEVNSLKNRFNCIFIKKGGSELDDLRLLHNANIAIGSNSTFAFWPICCGKSKIAIFPIELEKNIINLRDCRTQGRLHVI